MRRLSAFSIIQPASVADAASALARYGDDARLYAGGTELLLAMKYLGLRYDRLVDLKTIDGLRSIERGAGHVRIGATATHRDIERSSIVREDAPVLADTAARVGNARVRTSGTIGGNLCFAEPHSDLATVLLALGAQCVVVRASEERVLSIDELIVGSYATSLGPEDVLTAVLIPSLRSSWRATYGKFQTHERPLVGVAVLLDVGEDALIRSARIAVGAATERPTRSPDADALLLGPVVEARARLPEAARRLTVHLALTDDPEGTAEYKAHLIGVFLRRQFEAAVGGNGPATLERRA